MYSLKKILIILLFVFGNIFAQGFSETLKRQGILQMQNGKYGEAIDLFNKIYFC